MLVQCRLALCIVYISTNSDSLSQLSELGRDGEAIERGLVGPRDYETIENLLFLS